MGLKLTYNILKIAKRVKEELILRQLEESFLAIKYKMTLDAQRR